ncbi:MAG: hypothetical protein ACFFAT_17235 [Promethearchaeota archaeon]
MDTYEQTGSGMDGDSVLDYGEHVYASSFNQINSSDYFFWSFHSDFADISVFAMDEENYDKYNSNEPGWISIVLSQNKTSDQGIFYPDYQDKWYIIFLNEDPLRISSHAEYFAHVNYLPINVVDRAFSLTIIAIGASIFFLVLLIKIRNQGKENNKKTNILHDNIIQNHNNPRIVNLQPLEKTSLLTPTRTNMITCNFCNEKIAQNHNYCSNCGARVGIKHE